MEEANSRLEAALEEAESAKLEAVADAEGARAEVRRKESMLEFVEQEVHNVKSLFAQKEEQLLDEARRRDADKQAELAAAQQAQASAEEAAERADARAEEAERRAREAEELRQREGAERARIAEELSARSAEVSAAAEEKGKVEAEMRLVLKAMDAQKAVASRNMKQLSRIYEDWSAANSP